jgi:hypothetical protein
MVFFTLYYQSFSKTQKDKGKSEGNPSSIKVEPPLMKAASPVQTKSEASDEESRKLVPQTQLEPRLLASEAFRR